MKQIGHIKFWQADVAFFVILWCNKVKTQGGSQYEETYFANTRLYILAFVQLFRISAK